MVKESANLWMAFPFLSSDALESPLQAVPNDLARTFGMRRNNYAPGQ